MTLPAADFVRAAEAIVNKQVSNIVRRFLPNPPNEPQSTFIGDGKAAGYHSRQFTNDDVRKWYNQHYREP